MQELLTWVLPLIPSLLLLGALGSALPRGENASRLLALLPAALAWAGSLLLAFRFQPEEGWQWGSQLMLVSIWRIEWAFGLDGLALPLLLMGSTVLLAAAAQPSLGRQQRSWLLALGAAELASLMARNLIMLGLCWELGLVFALAMLHAPGPGQGAEPEAGSPPPRKVLGRSLLPSLGSSSLMLLAFLAFGVAGGTYTIPDLVTGQPMAGGLYDGARMGLAAAILLGVAGKIPVAPLHTPLRRALAEAPLPLGGPLAALWLLAAAGLLLRLVGLLPETAYSLSVSLAALGAISTVYGSLLALAQREVRALMASLAMVGAGWLLLGLATLKVAGVESALFLAWNQAAAFLLLALCHGREGRVAQLGSWLGLAALAGLPLSAGFPALFGVLYSAWSPFPFWCLVAGLGVLLGAAALWRLKGLEHAAGLKAAAGTQASVEGPAAPAWACGLLALAILVLGCYPPLLRGGVEPAVRALVARF